jgi:tRNA nucleotidyltransferase/poly(A) polymerase
MSDYNFLMESKLSPRHFRVLNQLAQAASAEGLNLYLVGGAVRDLTDGRQIIRDLDFSVEGNPEKVLHHLEGSRTESRQAAAVSLFPADEDDSRVEEIRYHARLRSADIYFASGARAELSQCRREDYTRPGKPPEITPATIFEDLRRRDFALNAMAVSLHPNSRGLLLDPTNGAGDIERQEIRALHSRSFAEDPSRIFRLLRLGQRLGYKAEEKTENWFHAALETQAHSRMTPEQQGRELEAILREENPARRLKLLADRGLLTSLDRALTRVSFDRFRKIRSLAEKFPDADLFLLNFDALTAHLGQAQRRRLATKIIPTSRALKLVLHLEREAKKLGRALVSSRAGTPSQVWRLLSTQPRDFLFYLLTYSSQSKVRSGIKLFLSKAPQVQSRLPRIELQAMGVNPGPKMDQILTQLFFSQLDGRIKTPQQLGKAMRALAGVKEPPKPAAPISREAKKSKAAAPPGGAPREEKPEPRGKHLAPQAKPAARLTSRTLKPAPRRLKARTTKQRR